MPYGDEKSSTILHYIDPYGNTIFNRIQMKDFLEEWEHLYEKVSNVEDKKLLDKVKKIAEKCRDKVHLYLKFTGD